MFELAPSSSITYLLRQLKVDGSTAFRDAMFLGINQILTYALVLKDNNQQQRRKFVHIIITDGEDNSSKVTLNDLCQLLNKLRQIPSSEVITYIFCVNFTPNQELLTIQRASGDNCQLKRINVNEIENVFKHILVELNIIQRQQTNVLVSNDIIIGVQSNQHYLAPSVSIEQYIVLFNIDRSSSMQPSWQLVCSTIQLFISKLTEKDIVQCIVFNNAALILQDAIKKQQQVQVQTYSEQQRLNTYPTPNSDRTTYQYRERSCCSKYKWWIIGGIGVFILFIIILASI